MKGKLLHNFEFFAKKSLQKNVVEICQNTILANCTNFMEVIKVIQTYKEIIHIKKCGKT